MKILSATLCLLVIVLLAPVQAQLTSLNTPVIIPKSPEAESFGRYGDIPVNEFTGTPNISIPLYTVKFGNIEIPISLSYHAAGVEVSQEATIVGLGWNLVAGGSINYVAVGVDERIKFGKEYNSFVDWSEWQELYNETSGGYIMGPGLLPPKYYYEVTYEEAEMMNNSGTNPASSQIYSTGYGVKYSILDPQGTSYPVFSPDLIYAGLAGEGEQDMYSANFLNYSFKFIIHPHTHEPIFVGEKNKCIISPTSKGFLITGEDGIKYYFDTTENNLLLDVPNCWYLSKIVDLQGNIMTLTYINYGSITPIPSLSENITYAAYQGCGSKQRILNKEYQDVKNLYLKEIVTDKERVVFEFETGRSDIKGTGARKLSAMRIKYRNSVEEDKILYFFKYSWFTGCTIGGDYLTESDIALPANTFSNDQLTKRLKLTDLLKVNPSDTSKKSEKYHFIYNETYQLPKKTSFARDFWGFYNGQENKSHLWVNNDLVHTMIPNGIFYSQENRLPAVPEYIKAIEGANRGMSEVYATTGMLKSITYPTGGRSEFEFEPHHVFSNKVFTYLSAEEMALIYPIPNSLFVYDYNDASGASSLKSDTLNLQIRTLITMSVGMGSDSYYGAMMTGAYVKLVGASPAVSGYINTYVYDPNGAHHQSWYESIYLEPGTYVISCDLPATAPYTQYANIVSGTLTYRPFNSQLANSAEHVGGGIRIKTITNYNENSVITSLKNYNYESGKCLKPVGNYRVEGYTKSESAAIGCNVSADYKHILSSNSYSPLSVSEIGFNVQYGQVEIENLNAGINNGKEIAFFSCYTADEVLNRYFFRELSAGDLIKKVYLDRANDTVRIEKFNYSKTDIDKEILNAQFIDINCGSCDTYHNRIVMLVYTTNNYFNQLLSKEIRDYSTGGAVSVLTEYTYNLSNYLPSQIITTQSDGSQIILKILYPDDYTNVSSGFISEMKTGTGHIINKPIEQYTLISNKATKGSLYTYKTGTYKGLLDKAYEIETTDPLVLNSTFYPSNNNGNFTIQSYYKPKITYDYYSSCNLLQYHQENDVNISYIWGYKNTLVTAKVINSENSKIAYTSFETSNDNGGWTYNMSKITKSAESSTGRYYYTLSSGNDITRGVTSGTYRIRYRAKAAVTVSATNGTVTAISESATDFNLWKLYEKSVTFTSNGTLKLSGSTKIDELRLYPEGAQMTTYTYDPLIGVTSITDERDITTYYEYDAFGRLIYIRDKNYKVLKRYTYHY
jgi:YD repeat-containing protein